MGSHYETLNVSSSASYEKIRAAYHDAARKWHPDRFLNATTTAAIEAEAAMRQANEAWRVLGDESKRRAYDRGLRGGGSGVRSGAGTSDSGAGETNKGVRTDGGVTRIDPRLLDPAFLDARRQAQLDEIANVHGRFLRAIPVVGFVALLIGIVIFTAYARRPEDVPVLDTVPGPAIGVAANACVRVIDGPQLLEVPCEGTNDGQVIGAYEGEGSCPVLTVREVVLFGDVTACLAG